MQLRVLRLTLLNNYDIIYIERKNKDKGVKNYENR